MLGIYILTSKEGINHYNEAPFEGETIDRAIETMNETPIGEFVRLEIRIDELSDNPIEVLELLKQLF